MTYCLRTLSRCQKLQKLPSVYSAPLKILSFQKKPVIRKRQSPSMFMSYIESSKIDWTVNDNLYNRFLKWKLKCENILDCELAMLVEKRKCKKVIAWSGDLGKDQYVSWCLPPEDLCFEVIWTKFEKFCKSEQDLTC